METDELTFGYCTNVHAAADLSGALSNLDTYATAVRDRVVGDGRLPVGLWLPEAITSSVLAAGQAVWLRDWLMDRRLVPYTLNGFPQGDFHQPVVKHAVYQPTWMCPSRARHTQQLAQILNAILPSGRSGSISTLPLGWPHAPWHAENFKLSADHLLETARFLDRITQQRGCEIVLAIEPEPGCVLDTAADIIEFFQRYLFSSPDAEMARRYLTVCHDVCHSSVMFEPQQQALAAYLNAGIRVGKVQISSAVHVPWDTADGQPEVQRAMLSQVQQFNEPKYLHQTTRCGSDRQLNGFCEDLSVALATWHKHKLPLQPWRIHFHLPIFVQQFGHLSSTQADISAACRFLRQQSATEVAGRSWFTGHYEVETYAWTVLPPELAATDLASGIARELQYFAGLVDRL
ncbi:MAG: metabolite traffic protein EboE [Pirellulaceae bacterium]|nr:metabolite traffic protein EboE [Pirellulaceae bacterium]